MVFFVHEGKVLVQVGPAGTEGNEFAISKGGVWVVPRGKLRCPLLSPAFQSSCALFEMLLSFTAQWQRPVCRPLSAVCRTVGVHNAVVQIEQRIMYDGRRNTHRRTALRALLRDVAPSSWRLALIVPDYLDFASVPRDETRVL